MITFCNSCVIMLIMTIMILTIGLQQLCVWLMMMTITMLTISFTTVVCVVDDDDDYNADNKFYNSCVCG